MRFCSTQHARTLFRFPESHAGAARNAVATIRPFAEPSLLGEVVAVCHSVFDRSSACPAICRAITNVSQIASVHLQIVSAVTDALQRQFGPRATPSGPSSNSSYRCSAPDVLDASAPQPRVGRAGEEADGIGLHRDLLFYGASACHLNLLVRRLAPLPVGINAASTSGGRDSPLEPPLSASAITNSGDPFRSSVKKGSMAHGLRCHA